MLKENIYGMANLRPDEKIISAYVNDDNGYAVAVNLHDESIENTKFSIPCNIEFDNDILGGVGYVTSLGRLVDADVVIANLKEEGKIGKSVAWITSTQVHSFYIDSYNIPKAQRICDRINAARETRLMEKYNTTQHNTTQHNTTQLIAYKKSA